MERDNVSIGRIATLISQDIGLAGRVLKLANSPIYSRSVRDTVSVDSAVQRIGFTEMKTVCLSVGVSRQFEQDLEHFDIVQLWKHSLCVAFATQAIVPFCRVDDARQLSREMLYTAGLMHDIGLVILARQLPEQYEQIILTCLETGGKLWQVEDAALGFNHADAGSWVVRHWGLPERLALIVQHHHDHDAAEAGVALYAKLLHVADVIAGMNGYGIGDVAPVEPFAVSAWVDLGLDDEDIPLIIQETEKRIETAELFAALAQGS
jgi:HD-like signal output (HDOD) protein